MALSKDERKVLRVARQWVKDDNYPFICHALEYAGKKTGLISESERLKSFVMNSIYPARTLGDWQFENGFGDRYNRSQRKADRLAWIDWMLDESKEA